MEEYSKQEIAQLKRIIADLQHQVEYDEVTGLLNSRGSLSKPSRFCSKVVLVTMLCYILMCYALRPSMTCLAWARAISFYGILRIFCS